MNNELKNVERLNNEFDNVVYNLKRSIELAKVRKSDCTGKIFMVCAYSIIRQTITFIEEEDKCSGWFSITIPPKRTVDGTPTMEFESDSPNGGVASLLLSHINSIIKMSQQRGAFYNIEEYSFENGFFLEKQSATAYWEKKYKKAEINMKDRLTSQNKNILIEVAAQHPLNEDGTPKSEFKERLYNSVLIYHKMKQKGYGVKIYVPGSKHMYNGKKDLMSLSNSGVAYLLNNGINKEDLYGEEMNNKYKGDNGVYNSADECYVASKIFLENDFNQIICICSSNQLLRKKFFYIEFGVIPLFRTIDVQNSAHSFIYEIFESVPNVIYNDHSWQEENSVFAKKSRDERKC